MDFTKWPKDKNCIKFISYLHLERISLAKSGLLYFSDV